MNLVVKYTLAALALLIITIFDVAYFTSADAHDAPLWTGLSMALCGLVAGALVNKKPRVK